MNNPKNWLAAVDGEAFYVCETDENWHLYRMQSSGSKTTVKLNEDETWFLNLEDDWLYYINRSDGGRIYRIRTDGSERQAIGANCASYLNTANGWLYYSNEDDGQKIYKMRIDGTGSVKLNDDCSTFLFLYDENIYYCNESDDNNIYKINIDGDDSKKFDNVASRDFCIAEGVLYFSDMRNNGMLYKLPLVGELITQLTKENSGSVNILGDWLYYIRVDKGKALYKIRINGKNNKKVSETQSWHINAVGEKVFFCSECEYDKLYVYGTNDDKSREVDFMLTGEDQDKQHNKRDITINGAGNSNNSSMAILKNGWVFYLGGVGRELYKARLNDSSEKLLGEVSVRYLNVADDWVYFCGGSTGCIKKVRNDGSGLEQLGHDSAAYLQVLDDWIYYVNVSEGLKIFKMRIDGSERVKLSDDPALYLNLHNDELYYIIPEASEDLTRFNNLILPFGYGHIYHINLDGSKRQCVSEEQAAHINIVGDWIYFINHADDDRIYRICIDGSKKKMVSDRSVKTINVCGDIIYYRGQTNYKQHNDTRIARMRTDGRGGSFVSKTANLHNINLVGHWVFGLNESSDMPYRFKNDGTSNSLLVEKQKYALTLRVKFANGQSYVYRTTDRKIELGSQVTVDGKMIGEVGEVIEEKVKYPHNAHAFYINEVISYGLPEGRKKE